MTNKKLFKQAKKALNKFDCVTAVDKLHQVRLSDTHDQIYLTIALADIYTHQDVFNHFEQVRQYCGKDAALQLTDRMPAFWIGQDDKAAYYIWSNELKCYFEVIPADVNKIINEFEDAA